MAPRQQKPFTVKVWGKNRNVVHRGKGFWIERLDDGALVSHGGNLLDGQVVHKTLPEPSKTCSKCKQPTDRTTPRGRGVHDNCGNQLDVLPDHVYWQVVFGIAADLGATLVTGAERPKEVRRAA